MKVLHTFCIVALSSQVWFLVSTEAADIINHMKGRYKRGVHAETWPRLELEEHTISERAHLSPISANAEIADFWRNYAARSLDANDEGIIEVNDFEIKSNVDEAESKSQGARSSDANDESIIEVEDVEIKSIVDEAESNSQAKSVQVEVEVENENSPIIIIQKPEEHPQLTDSVPSHQQKNPENRYHHGLMPDDDPVDFPPAYSPSYLDNKVDTPYDEVKLTPGSPAVIEETTYLPPSNTHSPNGAPGAITPTGTTAYNLPPIPYKQIAYNPVYVISSNQVAPNPGLSAVSQYVVRQPYQNGVQVQNYGNPITYVPNTIIQPQLNYQPQPNYQPQQNYQPQIYQYQGVPSTGYAPYVQQSASGMPSYPVSVANVPPQPVYVLGRSKGQYSQPQPMRTYPSS